MVKWKSRQDGINKLTRWFSRFSIHSSIFLAFLPLLPACIISCDAICSIRWLLCIHSCWCCCCRINCSTVNIQWQCIWFHSITGVYRWVGNASFGSHLGIKVATVSFIPDTIFLRINIGWWIRPVVAAILGGRGRLGCLSASVIHLILSNEVSINLQSNCTTLHVLHTRKTNMKKKHTTACSHYTWHIASVTPMALMNTRTWRRSNYTNNGKLQTMCHLKFASRRNDWVVSAKQKCYSGHNSWTAAMKECKISAALPIRAICNALISKWITASLPARCWGHRHT